jgi:hypothetical protein
MATSRGSIRLSSRTTAIGFAVVVGTLLWSAVPAAAQNCSLTYSGVDVSAPGNARLQAGTIQQGCPGVEAQVRARISAALFPGCSGTWYGYWCGRNNGSGNAVVRATSQGCGQWTSGRSHYAVISGSTVTLASDLETTFDAYGPPVECPPGWSPDGQGGCKEPSPIMITLRKGNRYELTSAADGVAFDIDGDGSLEQVAWTAPDSEVAFLAMDRDGDGLITSGKELFGNNTLPGATNGFDALARMSRSTNGGIMRGSVSEDDPLFAQLLLWTDANHNGSSESWELQPASELLSDIGLGYHPANRKDKHGNLFRFRGWASVRTEKGRNRARGKEQEDARHIHIWDAYLQVVGLPGQ